MCADPSLPRGQGGIEEGLTMSRDTREELEGITLVHTGYDLCMAGGGRCLPWWMGGNVKCVHGGLYSG